MAEVIDGIQAWRWDSLLVSKSAARRRMTAFVSQRRGTVTAYVWSKVDPWCCVFYRVAG